MQIARGLVCRRQLAIATADRDLRWLALLYATPQPHSGKFHVCTHSTRKTGRHSVEYAHLYNVPEK